MGYVFSREELLDSLRSVLSGIVAYTDLVYNVEWLTSRVAYRTRGGFSLLAKYDYKVASDTKSWAAVDSILAVAGDTGAIWSLELVGVEYCTVKDIRGGDVLTVELTYMLVTSLRGVWEDGITVTVPGYIDDGDMRGYARLDGGVLVNLADVVAELGDELALRGERDMCDSIPGVESRLEFKPFRELSIPTVFGYDVDYESSVSMVGVRVVSVVW